MQLAATNTKGVKEGKTFLEINSESTETADDYHVKHDILVTESACCLRGET